MGTAHYWTDKENRSKLARQHTDYMYNNYISETIESAKNTRVYDSRIDKFKDNSKSEYNTQGVIKDTTTGVLFRLNRNLSGKVALLNFASYKNPGGKFLEGSSAQEESLCMVSNLYNILSSFGEYYGYNNHNLNNGLYTDRALYTPDVIFINPMNNTLHLCDVITCAAPNRSLLRYGRFTEENNYIALKSRIEFLRNVCVKEQVDTVILGAWGCGVFMQRAEVVSQLLFETFRNTRVNCIYAVPDDKNYNIFLSTYNKH